MNHGHEQLLQPRSLGIGKFWNEVRHPLLFPVISDPEPCLDSTRIAESQGSPSHLRVEVTGMCLNPESLIPDKCLIFFSVLRAQNVPNIKNRFGKTMQFFVTVASQTTKKKTSSVPTEGPTVDWNENVGALYDIPFVALFVSAENSVQLCTIVFTS